MVNSWRLRNSILFIASATAVGMNTIIAPRASPLASRLCEAGAIHAVAFDAYGWWLPFSSPSGADSLSSGAVGMRLAQVACRLGCLLGPHHPRPRQNTGAAVLPQAEFTWCRSMRTRRGGCRRPCPHAADRAALPQAGRSNPKAAIGRGAHLRWASPSVRYLEDPTRRPSGAPMRRCGSTSFPMDSNWIAL